MSKTHVASQTPEFKVWQGMIRRCYEPTRDNYRYYGGRGITVCDRWLISFQSFLKDMGKRPSPEHRIERKDNDGGYSPDNCRWATRAEQCRNTTRNRWLVANGKRRLLADWARDLGIDPGVITRRIDNLGWPVDRAVTEPSGPTKRKTFSKRPPNKPKKRKNVMKDDSLPNMLIL